MSDQEPDRHAEDEDRELLREYDACPENFRVVIETPITDAMRLQWWRESCLEAATVDKILDSHADLERETVLLRRQRDKLADALKWVAPMAYSGGKSFGDVEPIKSSLALLKQLP